MSSLVCNAYDNLISTGPSAWKSLAAGADIPCRLLSLQRAAAYCEFVTLTSYMRFGQDTYGFQMRTLRNKRLQSTVIAS